MKDTEIAKLFVFFANVSQDAEWSLCKFEGGFFSLATSHKESCVSSIENENIDKNLNEYSLIFGIHSHPGKDATKGASGANVSINGKSDMLKMKKW